MTFLLYFLLQSTLASTILCLADRAIHQRPLFSTRSHCFSCGHNLSWYELIPFLSALFLRFRCANCQQAFGSLGECFLFELLFPLVMASLPFDFQTPYLLAYPLLFLAREDSQGMAAHTDFVWVIDSLLLIFQPPAFNWPLVLLFLLLLFFVLQESLGLGDLPVFLLSFLVFDLHHVLFLLFLASTSGLFAFFQYQHKKMPMIPFLLFSWLFTLLVFRFK